MFHIQKSKNIPNAFSYSTAVTLKINAQCISEKTSEWIVSRRFFSFFFFFFSLSALHRHDDFIDVEQTVLNGRIIKNKSPAELLTSVTVSIIQCERTRNDFGGEG